MVLVDSAPARRPRAVARRLARGVAALTTPLLPDDYLGLVDPLWSASDLRARVVAVQPEAAGAATLVLRPGLGWTGHRAGQWVRVGVEVDGVLHRRSYSLTAPPRSDGLLSITVTPVAGGLVSQVLARDVRPGQVLRLDNAAGDFVLPDAAPAALLFVSAGSGLTPVMGMLRQLAAAGPLPDVVLLHSAGRADDVLFGRELRGLAARHPSLRLVERHTGAQGRLTPDLATAAVPDWRDRAAFACGPAGLLDAFEAHWQDAGLTLHTERFAPRRLAGAEAAGGGTVSFSRSGATASAPGGSALLDAGEAAGVLLPSGCRMGICFGCVVPLLAGQVRDLRTGEVHGEPGDLVQTCICAAAGDCALDA